MQASEGSLTALLLEWRAGDSKAIDSVIPVVYGDLRRLAESFLRSERNDHTLQATALVHETYLRLLDKERPRWSDRAHFFAVASLMMRRILIDHARSRSSQRRGGERSRVELDESFALSRERSAELLALDEVLIRLSRIDRRKSRVVELRFFGGLTIDETAKMLGLAAATVVREWRLARAWLLRELDREGRAATWDLLN